MIPTPLARARRGKVSCGKTPAVTPTENSRSEDVTGEGSQTKGEVVCTAEEANESRIEIFHEINAEG
jgi:hypothetical protein